MIYRVEVSPAAQRNLRRIIPQYRDRIEDAIYCLAVDPHPRGSVKIQGEERSWRIRAGRFRIVYEIRADIRVVVILKVARRDESTYRT